MLASQKRKSPALRGLIVTQPTQWKSVGDDADDAATLDAFDAEQDFPGDARIERVIAPHAHIRARMIVRAALPHEDVAGEHVLTAETLDAKPF
jgi:hypothetical protein